MAYDKQKSETYELLGGRNSKASPYATGPSEFRELVNLNFTVPGALTQRPGTADYAGATVSGKITGGVEFERLSGASYIVATANTNAYTVTQGAFTTFKSGLLNNAIFDFVTLVDRLFACNGQDFFKFDGQNTSAFSLPSGFSALEMAAAAGGSLTAGVTGTFIAAYAYINDRGYVGPVSRGFTITVNGVTTNSIDYYGLTIPSGFGISGIMLFRSSAGGVDLFGTTIIPGISVSSGAARFNDPGWPLTTRAEPDSIYFTLIPKYMEIYNNQLFLAGFSSQLSTVWWSQIGEPEGIEPTFHAEFRTNDGDRITGMKAYSGSLVVAKERSFHRVTGNDPEDFLFREVTDQYGCVSNRAMIVWEDKLWFLDTKGIVEYDGATPRVVSTKVEDIFSRMNLYAARDQATAIHDRQRNELWFAIPIDGSTENNAIVVYDYVAQAWTVYEGIKPSVLFMAKGALGQRLPFYGGYTGTLGYASATLPNDLGRAITCMLTPSFEHPRGQTTENMYRRFYLNTNPILGITLPISVHLRTNYGTTIQATRTMYRNPFQGRIDFGLSAKSIQAQVIHSSASFPITVYGYAFESRFQRAT